MTKMTEKKFLWIGRLEGVSLLVLICIAMPLKYLMHEPEMVAQVGRLHGGLFIAYLISGAILSDQLDWSKKKLALSWLLSCVPFGTFIFEKKFMKG